MSADNHAMLVVAVDIGSTRAHIGLVDTFRRRCLFREDFLSSKIEGLLPAAVTRLLRRFPRARSATAVIAGGSHGGAQKAGNILKKKKIARIVRLRWRKNLPLRIRYKSPRALGADRIADALYAVTVFPRSNVIIIDSGTAITVDAVDRSGGFIGGTILAGVGTQLRCLHMSTNTLPVVTLPDKVIPFPGASTAHCMQAGAAYGTAGALNYLVRKYRSLLRGNTVILATGGAWHTTKKLVDFAAHEEPALTLIGTALYAFHCG